MSSKILDHESIRRAVLRVAHEILEKNKGTEDLCIVGIRTRGRFWPSGSKNASNRSKGRRSRSASWISRFIATM